MRVCSASGVTSDNTIFVDALQQPVGNSLAHDDAGDLVNKGCNALQVLNVHGGEDIDLVLEQLQNVFVALVVLAAVDVGVGQLIDDRDLRTAREDGVDVHLLRTVVPL